MRKRIITGIVLVIVFIVAVFGFSFMLNQGTDDITADMGSASLPTLSFQEGEYTINELPGYTESMDITTMRDLLLPLSVGTSVQADVSGYSGKIHSATYEVFSLDGEKSLKKETIKNVKDSLNMELGDTISDGGEKMLRIKLKLDKDRKAYYYIRVVRAAEFNVHQCLEFAKQMHQTTFTEDPEELNAFKLYMPWGIPAAGSSLQKVTLESDISQIGWGSLEPELMGDIRWQIKESTETYTSVYLKYQVTCEEDIYNVNEFFKVRCLGGTTSLEDYSRTMNQVFSGTEKDFDNKGINLGIADANVPYLVNKDGDMISFVQERELWNYNKKENEVSLVFSFAEAENQDTRNYNDNHEIRLIDMDKKGNTTFAVYGYMNRGIHEGQVGTAIYYFDIAKSNVEEKAFIPSKKSGEIARKKLNQLIYYSESKNMLYVMFDGTLYQIDLETKEKEVLVKDLKESQYVASEDGKYLAYQSNGSLTKATAMKVWNLKSGKHNEIEAASKEVIRPLGFVQGDIIYGIGKRKDIGKTAAGETILPLYKLEIRNAKNEVAKTYNMKHIYVQGVRIENNMVTLERVKKDGERYTNISPDYITNNKEQEKQTIKVETYLEAENAPVKVRLTDESRIEDTNPKLLKPKQKLFEEPTTLAFDMKGGEKGYYVYAHGRLQGIYEEAGAAIQAADPLKGVVVTSKQTKIWERGNRQLRYSLDGASAVAVQGGENSLTVCLREMLSYAGKKVDVEKEMKNGKSVLDILNEYSGGEALDLSGCTLEELFYIIGKGTPVIAMTGGNSAILLVGYSDTMITYINPQTGKKPTESIEAIEQMVSGSQGTFIGYVK